jgi:tryptophan halogenase
VNKLLSTLRSNVEKTVASLPDHDAYVARYCGAVDASAA